MPVESSMSAQEDHISDLEKDGAIISLARKQIQW